MKNKKRFMRLPLLLMVSLLVFVISCEEDFGTRKQYGNLELYYTDKITEEEANAYGEYLYSNNYSQKRKSTIQLTKRDSTFIIRMVMSESALYDEETIESSKIVAAVYSSRIFYGMPVEIHHCDNKLTTRKKIPMTKSNQKHIDLVKKFNYPFYIFKPSNVEGFVKDLTGFKGRSHWSQYFYRDDDNNNLSNVEVYIENSEFGILIIGFTVNPSTYLIKENYFLLKDEHLSFSEKIDFMCELWPIVSSNDL